MNCYECVREEALKRFGIQIPEIENVESAVIKIDNPEPGAIVAIREGGAVGHVGLMIDNLNMLHFDKKRGKTILRIDHVFVRDKIVGFYKCK